METTDYGMRVELTTSYDAAIQSITEALKAQGFGILTEIDVQATLKEKLGIDTDRYIILGACNPQLAHRALQLEPEIGLLLPCNVIVYEAHGGEKAVVSAVDPLAMLRVAGNPELDVIANEARSRLRQALDEVAAAG